MGSVVREGKRCSEGKEKRGRRRGGERRGGERRGGERRRGKSKKREVWSWGGGGSSEE